MINDQVFVQNYTWLSLLVRFGKVDTGTYSKIESREVKGVVTGVDILPPINECSIIL